MDDDRAWLLFVTAIVYVLYALFSMDAMASWMGHIWKPLDDKRGTICRILGIIGLPLSLGVAIYTGILLGSAPAIPLWNTWLLPALFTVSALDTGVAIISAYAILGEKSDGAELLRKIFEGCIVILIAVEATVLWVFLSSMLNGSLSESLSAQIITSGALSLPFWVLIVGIGLCIPFIAGIIKLSGIIKREIVILPVVGVIAALIGGFTLRYVILAAGSHAIMTSPALQQLIDGVYYFVP
jgi:formate-dependent nitrite reductase membrane component NrfD